MERKRMRFAAIGRSGALHSSIRHLVNLGFQLAGILTDESYAEYDCQASDFVSLGRHLGAPVKVDRKVNSPETIAWLESLNADVAISVNWKTVIGPRARSIFPAGVLNAHLGDLPRFRGNATPNWAIILGERRVALVIHNMVDDIDAGPIWCRAYMQISNDTRLADVLQFVRNEAGPLFGEALCALEAGESPTSQVGKASRCYPRHPRDGLIDWSESADSLARLVAAVSEPLTGAYTHLDTRILTIWRAHALKTKEKYYAVPGQVIGRDTERGVVVVATGDGDLELSQVQMSGNARMPAAEVIRSVRARLGMAVADEIVALHARLADLEAQLVSVRRGIKARE